MTTAAPKHPDDLPFSLVQRIHERIDATGGKIDHLTEKVNTLSADVRENLAVCEICRPKVLGNGTGPLDAQVAELRAELALQKAVDQAAVNERARILSAVTEEKARDLNTRSVKIQHLYYAAGGAAGIATVLHYLLPYLQKLAS